MRSHIANISLIGLVLSLSACASPFEPKINTVGIESESVFSALPSLSQTVVKSADARLFTCLGRGADATFSQADSGDISISIISTGSSSDSDKADNSQSSGETEMGGRTPGVLMAREMFYRTCEFSNNYQLSKSEAMQLYVQTLNAVSKGWGSEVEKTTITIGETVTVNDTVTTSETSANSMNNTVSSEPLGNGSGQPATSN